MLEKELKVLHFDSQATGCELSVILGEARTKETLKPTVMVTHLLQQSYPNHIFGKILILLFYYPDYVQVFVFSSNTEFLSNTFFCQAVWFPTFC